MWLIFAIGSAVFAGITSILAKCGIRHTDSTVATALRTVVVLLFSWILAVLQGTASQVQSVDGRTWFSWFFRDWQPALPGSVISGRCRLAM